MNGWTKEQDTLMAEWADIAGCYRWLHDRSHKIYSKYNMSMTIPVIILSTLTGTANFAIDSFVPQGSTETKKYVAAGIGGLSIFAGILTTLGNFFQFAQKSEAHKVASVAWGKFQRQITVELAIHPDERIEAMDFLKMCRQDLDRLIEQSPAVPDMVIAAFETEFKTVPNLKVPDICHGIEHTRIYDTNNTRLGKITAEAALHLKYKKNALANSILPDLDKKIEQELSTRIEERIKTIIATTTPPPERAKSPGGSLPPPAAATIPVETDWRRLLVSRRNILQGGSEAVPPPTRALSPLSPKKLEQTPAFGAAVRPADVVPSIALAEPATKLATSPEEVRINIVGQKNEIIDSEPTQEISPPS
jgi:hypothetical protein